MLVDHPVMNAKGRPGATAVWQVAAPGSDGFNPLFAREQFSSRGQLQ